MFEQIIAFKTLMTAALAEANLKIDNIVTDEAGLTATILALQAAIAANPGSTLSPEDQAVLDEIAVQSVALRDRLQTVAAAVPDSAPSPLPPVA